VQTDLESWVGRSVVETDDVHPGQARALAALLDRDPEALAPDALPELWHWVHFRPTTRQSELGPDGHARRGGFLPPVELPRRMWVGGRLRFLAPLPFGVRAERRSTIRSISSKSGRSGDLCFVTVLHEISSPAGPAVEEEQDIVYRSAQAGGAIRADEPPADAAWSETFHPGPVELFRFSALTFNGHRIHYDHPYTTGVEGYPGLVVHGPLTALLQLEVARRARAAEGLPSRPARYEYRAVSPLFAEERLVVSGRPDAEGGAAVWASGPRGLVMTGRVEWAG